MLTMLLSLSLVLYYPIAFHFDSGSVWLPFSVVLMMLARHALCLRLIRGNVRGSIRFRWMVVWLTAVHVAGLAAMSWIFLANLAWPRSGQMILGYLFCDLLAAFEHIPERRRLSALSEDDVPGEQVRQIREELLQTNAYKVYSRLSALVLAAASLTTVLLFTRLAVSTELKLTALAFGIVLSIAAGRAADLLLYRRQRRRGQSSDPSNVLILGLLLWLYALTLFRFPALGGNSALPLIFRVGLCSVGISLCMTSLGWMEQAMEGVARFTQNGDVQGFRTLRSASAEMASLVGEMLALVGLTFLCFTVDSHPHESFSDLANALQPLLLIPAVLIVLMALLFAFRFPLSSNAIDKLFRFLHLKEDGGSNPALEKQLDSVVRHKAKQPFGIRTIRYILRVVYPHRLVHAERIRQDPDDPVVFLCNHSEIYGPVASVANIPCPIRPWTIDKVSEGREAVTQYMLTYTYGENSFVPRPLRPWAARATARLSIWCMNSLNSIRVYRDQPAKLMQTFRASVEAMQAGDNLLIFPENPNAVAEGHGYEHDTIGEFFSGFAMVGQIYAARTGKRCRFLPMYADKNSRSIAFGEEILYDPDRDPTDERQRVADEAREQMISLMRELQSADRGARAQKQ